MQCVSALEQWFPTFVISRTHSEILLYISGRPNHWLQL